MSALPGGAADKIGNQFESWWTLNRLWELLRGDASRMRIEPPGDEGEGIEFWIEEGGVRWCEQVKHMPSERNWSLGALKKRKVLERVLGHLEGGHNVRLVFSTPAHEMAALTARVRNSANLAEFRTIATAPSQELFEALTAHWEVPESDGWRYLRNLHIEQHTEHDLELLVRSRFEQIVSGNPEIVMNELSGWLVSQLHQTIRGPAVWAHLKKQGFERRYLVGDAGVQSSLLATIERHRRRVSALRPQSVLTDQTRIDAVIDWLTGSEPDRQQVLLLHGDAGSGKSTLIESVLEKLQVLGWHSAVLSMERPSQNVYTSQALGNSAELSASPAVLLSGVADGSPAALFIDQLDAVASYSGRMQDNYESVDEVLSEATANPNLRIVLVVRSVDLRKDPRLDRLRGDTARVAELHVGRFTPVQVSDALERSGIDPSSVDVATMKLLEVPLHYAVFNQLNVANKAGSFSTLQDLYARFTEQTMRDVRNRVGSLNWPAITGPVIRYMSQNEVLRAPASILRSADPWEVGGLLSCGILFEDNSTVSFFHETYFDYLFADSFIADGGDLEKFLEASGQALFRRAQTRQVLEYLVKIDRSEFRRTVTRLLSNGSIRSHLLDIPITLLGQLDATAEDWQALRGLALGNSRRSRQLLALLSAPAWFDAVDAAGEWENLLASEEGLSQVANQLISAARSRPERVAELVRPHVGESEAWKAVCSSLLAWSISPGLVPLAVELLEAGQVDGVRGPIAVNSDFWTILYELSEEAPSEAAKVMGAYLRRASALATKDGIADPFDSDHLPNSSSSGGEGVISKIAVGAPESFIAEALPFVTCVLEDTARSDGGSELRHGSRWHHRFPGEPTEVDDAVFFGLETAFRGLHDKSGHKLLDLVQPLMRGDIEELRFLACRALTTSSLADESVQWLVSDPRNLELGYLSGHRWATRELIECATKSCETYLLDQLAALLLSYHPAYEKTAHGRPYFGRAQFELLSAIDPTRRNFSVIQRLHELERKFGNQEHHSPRPVTADFAGPPIPVAAAIFLSDGQWIEAIRTHEGDKVDWSHANGPRGGRRELSHLLGQQAAEEPVRFAHLALELNESNHATHIASIISAVAGKIPIDLLALLCVHGRRVGGQEVDPDICRAVREVAAVANDVLVNLVVSCSSDDDPERETARTGSASGGYFFGGDLSTAGLNCTRGAAAGSLAYILFAQPHRSEQLVGVVRNLAADPIMAVRVRTAEAILALLNTLPDAALDIAEDMFRRAPVDIFDARETSELLKHSCLRRPKTFSAHLLRALEAEDSIAERAGQVWVVACVNGALEDPAPYELSDLNAAARKGVAKALSGSPGVVPKVLVQLLNDEDPEVRKASARALRHVHELDQQSAELLVQEFIGSAAFPEHTENLFASLDRSTTLLPPSTIDACERALDIVGRKLGDIRTAGPLLSLHLIAVLLRLYKQENESIRRRCLDVIDRLSELGAYGLDGALDQERL
jgi:hypothetical protein